MAMSQATLRAIRRGLTVSLTAGLLGAIWVNVRTFGPETMRMLRRVNLSWVLLACALMTLTWVLEACRVQLLLSLSGETVPLRRLLRVVLATIFAAGVTPFASGQGPVQVYLLHRQGASVGRAAAVLTLRLFLTLLTFAVAIPLVLLALRSSLPVQLDPLLKASITASLLAVGASAAVLRRPRYVTLALHAAAARVLPRLRCYARVDRLLGRLLTEADEFASAVSPLDGSRCSRLLAALGLTILYWLCCFGIAPLLLTALGRTFSPAKVLAQQAVFSFLLSVLPVPGGSGLAELGFAALFAHLLPAALVGVFVFLWRALTYYLPMVAGAFSCLGLLRPDQAPLSGDGSSV